MDNALKQILESQVLNENVKDALVEAWNEKISEARQQIEEQVRDEMAKRYEHDKGQLVEAMEKFLDGHLAREVKLFADTKSKLSEETRAAQEAMTKKIKAMKGVVTETLRKELEAVASEKKALAEERVKLNKIMTEAKSHYAKKANVGLTKMQNFVMEQLKKEIAEFAIDKKELSEEKIKLHKDLRESRMGYKEAFADRLSKLEKFVLHQLQEELGEFQNDRKLLENRRVELETTAKKKLEETQKAFIAKASKLVESTMMKSMRGELTQLKEDLKVARENNFGRRIFESFAAEFMTSYLAEGSEIRKLQNQLNEVKKTVVESQKKVTEKEAALAAANRKIQLTEERAERARILSDLLTPLSRDQKTVMSNLLNNVKTEKLNESFKRYLPAVLRETGNKMPEAGKKVLSEARKEEQHSAITVTGDRQMRLVEGQENDDNDPGVIELRKLAGIH